MRGALRAPGMSESAIIYKFQVRIYLQVPGQDFERYEGCVLRVSGVGLRGAFTLS